MSFSVQDPASGLEWSGSSLNTVFAQRRNLLSPRFLGMLRDIVRFNRLATAHRRARGAEAEHDEPIGDFLDRHRFGPAFRQWLLPADDRLHLVLPHRPDAALSGGHHDPLLPQPTASSR